MSIGKPINRWNRLAILLSATAVMGLSGCVMHPNPDGSVSFGWGPIVEVQPEPQAPPQQEDASPPDAPQAAPVNDLQTLVAPIALYPDPLLADVLAASTFPDQIQAAAQWLQYNSNPTDDQIAAQPWDPSVQALAHYPTVVTYMSQEIAWTTSLGSAVSTEGPSVTASVQELRAQALADGNLHDTPEQHVVVEGDPIIYILPRDPGLIYVPTYDPVLVYSGPYQITFGASFVAGTWLGYGFDWDHHSFYHGDWRGGWRYGPDGWRHDHHWHSPEPWHRDGRWGEPPHVDRYRFRHEMDRPEWHRRTPHKDFERPGPRGYRVPPHEGHYGFDPNRPTAHERPHQGGPGGRTVPPPTVKNPPRAPKKNP